MRADGHPRVWATFVCVDQKQNAEIRNEEIFHNIEALSLVRTTQQEHSSCNDNTDSNDDVIGNDIVFVV